MVVQLGHGLHEGGAALRFKGLKPETPGGFRSSTFASLSLAGTQLSVAARGSRITRVSQGRSCMICLATLPMNTSNRAPRP